MKTSFQLHLKLHLLSEWIFIYYMIPLDLYIKCPHSAGLFRVTDETIDGVMNAFHYILNPPRTCQLVVHHLFIFVCIINSHALS